MKSALQSLIVRWMFSKVPFPAPAFLIPHIFGWAIQAKSWERLNAYTKGGRG